ncbi:hypothetical protein FGM00_16285 [Aggregatimonas sangjinii]|uniref:Uncharacterized protein n=1 Tax=Aggregatimonas sangjinii TaxID=2583587 RepID=A0A5B7SXC8_9FLAO|nr:hypothetical protein [Aggregatimonas sangjinii]QCX01591.1 hypothetical protein FGM00_16285 [Aggregatimonas sangjinii]
MKVKKPTTIKTPEHLKMVIVPLLSIVLTSCMGEVKEKLNKAKDGLSNTTTFVKEVQGLEGKLEKFKDATPLTNEQLKEWLPQSLDGLERTGFKIGQTGMYQVNSVEGTYKETEGNRKFNVLIIDGAGPTGSMMAAGYSMFGKMEMETEDEYKHQRTVTKDGITAQQTYKKKTNDTQLLFAFEERFLVTINSYEMNVDETWNLTKQLNLDELANLAE